MAAPPLLTLQDVALVVGGSPLIEGAELAIGPGERACLVGRNGSGKSTLLKVAAGLVEPDRGRRFVQPGATIRYLPQEPLVDAPTTLAYVEAGLGPGDDPYRARVLLEGLGLTGEEEPARLSGGEARRAALARAMAPRPDILLLDEPTNHLDLPAIEWLEAELNASRSALVLVSHDRRFLEALSRATVWLDRGATRRLDRGFAAFEAWRDGLLEAEERDRHKLDRKIAAEEDWLRYGVTARRKRNVRRLGALHDLRRASREARRPTGLVAMTTGEGERSGTLVIEAKGVAKDFGERAIVRDLSLRVVRGDRLGIVGPNGAGKTTLVNLLTGALAPDAGVVRLGASVEMIVLDQGRATLDDADTLAEVLTGGRGDTVTVAGRPRHVVGYLKDFLFAPEQARTPVGVLSGGERNRLLLARALARPSNLLVLDEPTNDLDLETLDLLEEMLADYPGTLLVVSHDRDFLDRVVGSVLVAEGEGRWVEYAGGYTDMVAQRGAGVAARTIAGRGRDRPARAGSGPGLGPGLGLGSGPGLGSRAAPEPARRKLGFKESHELATLPGRMRTLEGQVADLSARLADAGLYARDPDGFAAASARLTASQAALAEAEERWLTLEMQREALGEGVEGRS